MTTEASEPSFPRLPFRLFLRGGLLGGLLCNVSGIALGALVLQADAARVLNAMESPPTATRMLLEHVLMRFGVGLAASWLYWAVRPRFQKRHRAVLAAATFLWLTSYVFSALLLEELRIYSTRTAAIGAAWGLVELVLVVATVAWAFRTEASLSR